MMDWHGRKRDEMAEHHERRPPVYNSEDYVAGLKKFCKLTGLQLYLGEDEEEELQNGSKITIKTTSGSSALNGGQSEMGLRQFSNISELLAKLKGDLNLSFPSFIREFIGSTNDGVTLLLEALKAIQLSQSNITGSLNQLGSRANHVMFKRALNDEFETLVCLKICSRSDDGVQRLAEHPSGLFTIAVCVMSNYSKSRVLSLQLLARLCDALGGHKQVSDSISMLRLRFGEPVRFKFLVGMLNSYNSSAFQISCLRFLNRFIETSKDSREKILIQTELEEAGFDTSPLKKLIAGNTVSRSDLLKEELNRWSQNYVDVNGLVKKLLDAERANRKLREEISLLKEKNRHMETEREELKSGYKRLQSELNDNAVLKFEMTEDVKFPREEEEEEDVDIHHESPLVTILNSNVVTEEHRTIITCSSSASHHKIIGDSGLSSNSSSTHEETKSLSDESLHHNQKVEEDVKEENGLEKPGSIRVNVKKTISKFNREAALRNRCGGESKRGDRIVGETIPSSSSPLAPRTPSPPPRCIGETLKAGDMDSFGIPLQTPNPPPVRSRRNKSNSNLGLHNENIQDSTKSFKKEWNMSKGPHISSCLNSSEESSSDGKESFFEDDSEQIITTSSNHDNTTSNTLETVSARSFGCFVRSAEGVKRHKSFFNGPSSKTRTRHGKPKDVMRRSESFHQGGRSYSVERLSDDPFHPNNFQRHLSAATSAAAAAASAPKKSSLSKSKSMEFLKAKLLSRKPSSVKSNKNKSSSSHVSQGSPCGQHQGFWSGVPPAMREAHNNGGNTRPYDWRQDTPFWRRSQPPPPPSAPPPPPAAMEDWLPGSPAFRNGWMLQNNRKFPSLFQQPQPRDNYQQPASYAFEDSTDLADRLEITELTDEEPDIPSPDYGGNLSVHHVNNNNSKLNGSFSSLKSGSSHKAGNILDMPSGLY